MCIRATDSLPGIYKPPELSKRLIHRPASTLTTLRSKTSPAPQDLSAPPPAALDDPYEKILLLEVLERHQELLYCSWISHAQSTAAVPALPCYPSAHPRTCYPSAHPRMCYPSAHPRMSYPSAYPRTCYPSAHSECSNQVHTQNVLSKYTLRMCYPSAHQRTY